MGTATVSATPKAFMNQQGGMKQLLCVVTGSASYATGGDTIDFSTSGTLGQALGFQTVTGCVLVGQDTAASTKYLPFFLPAAADAAATGKLKLHDITAASDAEVTAATDLSAVTFRFLVYGT
jgi:hypothetical protein